MTIEGTCCSALVATGSSATLVRPDVLGKGTTVSPTGVKLQTVTRERAPMVGEAVVTLGLRRTTIHCPVWIADVDHCILGLGILKTLGCVIDTRRGTLTLPDGHQVQMSR